ncbi:MAG: tyrosine-type recombinase/integrase [Lachnospiraceae bacterium]|nr:tyrosine-type recombinase/integrase [Lachnospiraceae bacterium]
MAKIKMTIENGITFEEGCEEYILDCKSRNLREGTIRHYRDTMVQMKKYIGSDTLVKEMTVETFNDFIVELRDNPLLNDQSLNTYARDLKTIMRFFMKREYIPYFKIEVPKADKQPIETYTDRELQVLLKKPNLKHCTFTEYKSWVMTNFLLSTGVRRNSIINIKIKDVDLEADVVHINITKSRKPIIIPLNADIKKILQEYLQYRKGGEDDYLFCNVFGGKVSSSSVYHQIYEYNKGRGINKTGMHRYRHTFAKKWVTMGGNVVTLQKILGHSSLEITQNYLNILVSDIKKDIEEFNILREFKKESIKMG